MPTLRWREEVRKGKERKEEGEGEGLGEWVSSQKSSHLEPSVRRIDEGHAPHYVQLK